MANPTSLTDVGGGAATGASFGSMFGPIGAAIGLGLGAAAGGVKAYGDYQGGQAAGKAFTYQAGVAQINAQIANQNARYATAVGESKAQISGMQTRAQLGTTKAIQGASGLNVNTGSAVGVRASEADIGEENEMTIRSDTARQAYGFKVQAAGDIAQSNLDLASAASSKTASKYGAISSLLGSAGSVAGKWAQFGQQGVFGSDSQIDDSPGNPLLGA